jgi:hypothetical protein
MDLGFWNGKVAMYWALVVYLRWIICWDLQLWRIWDVLRFGYMHSGTLLGVLLCGDMDGVAWVDMVKREETRCLLACLLFVVRAVHGQFFMVGRTGRGTWGEQKYGG